MTLEQLTEAVWSRLEAVCPKVLLIGDAPGDVWGVLYVAKQPCDAVLLGKLEPSVLLAMPSAPVCEALLHGIPVYYWPDQSFKRMRSGKLLQRELRLAEDKLRRIGVHFLNEPGPYLTCGAVEQLLKQGRWIPMDARLSPKARERWKEEWNGRWNGNGKLLGNEKM